MILEVLNLEEYYLLLDLTNSYDMGTPTDMYCTFPSIRMITTSLDDIYTFLINEGYDTYEIEECGVLDYVNNYDVTPYYIVTANIPGGAY